MKAFGLELRKADSIGNLYRDVDSTLSRYSIPPGGVTQEIQVQAVAHALQKMIAHDNYFSVCTVDNCRKVCQIHIPIERQHIYSAAHCMDWGQMTADYKQMLLAMLLDDFRSILSPTISTEVTVQ